MNGGDPYEFGGLVEWHDLSSDTVRSQPPFGRGVFGGIPLKAKSKALKFSVFCRDLSYSIEQP
jgi:hypothetical protein